MIELQNLTFGYAQMPILRDISLQIKRDDFIAIIGPNGAGKSTLLKLILGLLKPVSGQIIRPQNPDFISFVPQTIPDNRAFRLTVMDAVLMGRLGPGFFSRYTKDDRQKAQSALQKVGIADLASRDISELSGGQRQRAYIARALCSEASMMALDEPLASIDAKGQVEIYELLASINAAGVGIIIISHDTNISLAYAKTVLYVASGGVFAHAIERGNTAKLLSHLKNEHDHFCEVELALGCACGH